jgi:quercetin dioxygenase-like cupin family protein
MKIFALAAATTLVLTAHSYAQSLPKESSAPQTIVKKIFDSNRTAIGQPIVLPKGNVYVVVSTYDVPPGAKLPVHKHPWPRYAYVLSGQLTVKSADGRHSSIYKAGDFIVEMLNVWHFGANSGTEPVRLLVIDQVQKNKSNTIVKD